MICNNLNLMWRLIDRLLFFIFLPIETALIKKDRALGKVRLAGDLVTL